jgi:hypothetical protein
VIVDFLKFFSLESVLDPLKLVLEPFMFFFDIKIICYLLIPLNLEKSVERGILVQDTGFTVLSKNFSFAYMDVGEGREQDAEDSAVG